MYQLVMAYGDCQVRVWNAKRSNLHTAIVGCNDRIVALFRHASSCGFYMLGHLCRVQIKSVPLPEE